MRPDDIQQIGNELAIKWQNGDENFFPIGTVALRLPVCRCKGEVDIMGNLYKGPERKLTAAAFQLVRLISVGGYAIQPVWADGHATGIFLSTI
ncbi:MAG: gamma-butyrobetaine hydroxylase-like domain-containing protein [Limisphaerales bacterium]